MEWNTTDLDIFLPKDDRSGETEHLPLHSDSSAVDILGATPDQFRGTQEELGRHLD